MTDGDRKALAAAARHLVEAFAQSGRAAAEAVCRRLGGAARADIYPGGYRADIRAAARRSCKEMFLTRNLFAVMLNR